MNDTGYRIVASDMDETLLAHDHHLPAANVEAIRKLRAVGCLFVPASGRAYGSVMASLAELPAELMEGSYVISYNGGCITRFGEDAPLVSHTMGRDRIRALFDHGKSLGICMHVYGLDGTVWGFDMVPAEIDYLKGHMDYINCGHGDLDLVGDAPLAKLLMVLPGALDKLHRLRDDMDPRLLEGVDTTFSSGRYLEFNPKGVNKGRGLAAVAQLEGVDLGRTIACGDAENDLDMIEVAGVGVAVSNASADVRRRANLVTTASCDDGVLAEVWHHLFEA
ncbi:Cof-type HAD-IIB family hydrolase [Olsenella sp. HMSC062G07]|uniref:Cof-type HAD-IIB family hydrolase n=1 Tax=Olsenella sp. HMSC062G07 TaxID=1739330 RepID=UPI0008A64126|nr:Cof-type HAD-IIB family hydrolase [Olsenella sp. HMSC062G07]OFK24820.1 hypothetical protein HMPREF2826_06250 [Olsenella sp. HMSC062G07]